MLTCGCYVIERIDGGVDMVTSCKVHGFDKIRVLNTPKPDTEPLPKGSLLGCGCWWPDSTFLGDPETGMEVRCSKHGWTGIAEIHVPESIYSKAVNGDVLDVPLENGGAPPPADPNGEDITDVSVASDDEDLFELQIQVGKLMGRVQEIDAWIAAYRKDADEEHEWVQGWMEGTDLRQRNLERVVGRHTHVHANVEPHVHEVHTATERGLVTKPNRPAN
jgi:hypothetical protein